MTKMTLSDLADKMRGIDIAILSTKSGDGEIANRPMSNNADVDYDGNSYYFTSGTSRVVSDIERNNHVSLSFSGNPGLISGNDFYLAVEGRAELIRDKKVLEEHWNSDLDRWFEKGVDTPDLVMIKVHATRIKYWSGEDQGELEL